MDRPRLRVAATVLGSDDAAALARFYAELLGWEIGHEEPAWVMLRSPDGGSGLSFQHEPEHVPPVWPGTPGGQQMMAHLDIAADDLDGAIAWALQAGARLADWQPQDDVRVLLDPAGHPFCLFLSSS
jgi:catechol 2,3-dioxygenase-like lactoylglutathione lyase family enzyme